MRCKPYFSFATAIVYCLSFLSACSTPKKTTVESPVDSLVGGVEGWVVSTIKPTYLCAAAVEAYGKCLISHGVPSDEIEADEIDGFFSGEISYSDSKATLKYFKASISDSRLSRKGIFALCESESKKFFSIGGADTPSLAMARPDSYFCSGRLFSMDKLAVHNKNGTLQLGPLHVEKFEMKLVAVNSDKGFQGPKLDITGEELHLEKSPIITIRDVEKAVITPDREHKGTFDVVLKLTWRGAAAFSDATEKNIGKRLGAIVGGRLTTALVIRGKMSGEKVIVLSGAIKPKAEMTARYINHAVQFSRKEKPWFE